MLFTDVAGAANLYAEFGDVRATALLAEQLNALHDVVATHRGAIVKTIGDAVMAVFVDPRDAALAAAAFGAAAPLPMRAGAHVGPCVALRANDRLDYAGATVALAARVARAAGAGEILFTAALADDARVRGALPGAERGTLALRGVAEPLEVVRIAYRRREVVSRTSSPLYDDPLLAASYARVTASNVYNAAYERPAVRALAGDVAGRDVLDAGCAAGENAAWLAERGARVVALDASAAMVELACARLGARGRVRPARSRAAAPVPRRRVRPRPLVADAALPRGLGRTVARARARAAPAADGSSPPPTIRTSRVDADAPYHAVRLVDEAWNGFADEPVRVRFYHRPLERIVGDVLRRRLRAACAARAVTQRRGRRARSRDRARALALRPNFLLIDAERPR